MRRTLTENVLILGAGLVGSSLGLALTRAGYDVVLWDIAASHALVAAGLGAGRVSDESTDNPDVVVVATPPDVIPGLVAEVLEKFPDAVITDVGSVKAPILRAIDRLAPEHRRYVGSHPMAGSQFTGPLTASGDLFRDRTWVVTPEPENAPADIAVIEKLARDVGARVVTMPAAEHDVAVAQVSHVPHLMSILTASHLRQVPQDNLQLAGQGIRDVTRIAGSDPSMWRQILTSNASAVRHELLEVAQDLAFLIDQLERPEQLEKFLGMGQAGALSLVGKHGQDPIDVLEVTVEIPDEPRALARLFTDIGEAGFNVEDFELTHDQIRQLGYLSISVEREVAEQLRANIVERGWHAWSGSRK
ncbi:prephenate dehydrogenase [Tessaracoccus bendigoensis DSM 12906]|uniref:Prephenate dehydrogenase n=1 Tax=Tessaracoccus bendigoensis DSM 12906 TaxID=1123357 RepID=A0A1M6IQV5_9ACTN|nr:prephenate dehydrogenase [Tessaracoccus bendigoensis]SHJ36860.1 prephenate dehydrogenase [Tessaracoccus bendigoensis DSM 12906]